MHNASEHDLSHPFPLSLAVGGAPQDTTLFSGLDASSSKQLAALTAAGNARRAQAQFQAGLSLSPPATSGSGLSSANYLGQIAHPDSSAAFAHAPPHSALSQQQSAGAITFGAGLDMHAPHRPPPPSALAPQHALALYRSRQHGFLQALAKMMLARNMPLPPAVTGVDVPFDPATSPWKHVEPGSELGAIRLAGRDVDLYKLWTLVYQAGSAAKMQTQAAWLSILPMFGLPEQLPHPQENGTTSTAVALAQLYMNLLGAFDEYYNKGMSEPQRHALAQLGRPFYPDAAAASYHAQNMNMPSNSPAVAGGVAQVQPPAQAQAPAASSSASPDASNQAMSAGSTLAADADAEARKRKLGEGDDTDLKRSRRKTEAEPLTAPQPDSGAPPPQPAQMSAPPASTGRVKMRRKIEYVPLSRELDTAGGRNVHEIQNEILRLSRGQTLRDINEWGKVYVDSLTMSIRSRISTELSYGLTTLILLSTMRSAAPDTGFLVGQCEELLEEVLDLLEELAFPDEADAGPSDSDLITNRQLVQYAQDEYSEPFAAEARLQGEYDPAQTGPSQRRGDLIRLVLNILRNLSAITDNQRIMAGHPVLTDLLLRLVDLRVVDGELPKAACKALTLPDLLVVRKDVLNTLVNLSTTIALFPPPSSTSPDAYQWRAQRLFVLVTSYLVDPIEAVSPSSWLMHAGAPLTLQTRAPLLPDVALEVFTRVSCLDDNRKAISRAIPTQWQRQLFDSLVHRLPSNEMDFKLAIRDESWLSYIQKLALGLYSLAFLMSPEMKTEIKKDRTLSFAKVMLRFVKRVFIGGQAFIYCARRSIEAMKLIDDASDMFDTAQPRVPTLAFGVGYGEANDKDVELGSGLLSAHREEVLWSLMMHSELDDVMFSELESLARVESPVAVH